MGWNRLRSNGSTGECLSPTRQPVTVGDRTYVPLELDGQLGHLRLSRGLTGRYHLDQSQHGTGSFRNGVVESDGERMLLFEGRNGDGHIARAVFSPEGGGPYALDIPASPVFLVSVPVEDSALTAAVTEAGYEVTGIE